MDRIRRALFIDGMLALIDHDFGFMAVYSSEDLQEASPKSVVAIDIGGTNANHDYGLLCNLRDLTHCLSCRSPRSHSVN